MPKKLVAGVIGASSESVYAIQEAKKRNIKVIAIDGNVDAPGLQYADEKFVLDICDSDAVLAFFGTHPIDFLLPVPVGRILTASGVVNTHFNLPGVSRQAADISTDKWLFHELLSKKNLRDAQAILINSAKDVEAASQLKYPVIIKPRFGSGSRNVKAYESFEGLRSEVHVFPFAQEDYVIETCKPGTEYGVDAMVLNGQYQMVLLREKLLTPLPYRQCVGYYAIEKNATNEKLIESVNSLVGKAVEVLGINDCLLHADVMVDGLNAFLVEISPRPSGHYLHNYFTRYACSFDMLSTFFEYASDIEKRHSYSIPYTYNAKSMLIKYFDLPEGVVKHLPSKDEAENIPGVIHYNCWLHVGDSLGKVINGKSVMGRGFYVVEAPTLAGCEAICKEVENKITIEV